MTQKITNKTLTIINFTIVFYFVIMYMIAYFKIDFVILGVFRELLTIPFLIAQFVFIIIGMKHRQKSFWAQWSLFALGICTLITVGSFF